jgi:hypothetical protein
MVSRQWRLKSAPLALEYRSDLWESVASDEGASIRHLAIPRCEIREGNSAEIKGKYKNQISIGTITYDIYGWLEDVYGVREYVYVSGLDELEMETKPLILVTIPFDNQEACLNDASEVLSKLYMLEK